MENKEIASLAQALVLSFAYAENGLSQLIEDYEILDVEKVRVVPLSDGIQFVSIEDGLLRSKSDGGLYVLSFKTTSQRWGKRMAEQGLYDTQGISESWAIKQELGERPLGVKMIYLHKGYKKFNDVTQDWHFENFLTRGWTVPGITPDEQIWNYTQYWPCPQVPHTLQSGRKCKGDGSTKNHKLPDTFQQVQVSEMYQGGVSGWIKWLSEMMDDLTGAGILQRVVITPETYFRSEEDIEEWFLEAILREENIAKEAEYISQASLNSDLLNAVAVSMARAFPKNRNACTNDFGRLCSFIPLCFKGMDPLGSGLYQLRTASLDDPRIDQMNCTSRSRGEVYQQCARKRFWSYEWMKGQQAIAFQSAVEGGVHIGGLQPLAPAIDAIIGGAVHKGLEFLLSAHLPDSDPRSEIKRGSGDLVWSAGEIAYQACLAGLPEQIPMSQVDEGLEDTTGLGIY